MKKAIGIARVSTERQAANDRVSHDEQEDKIRRWCEENDYQCLDVLREVVSRNDRLRETQPETRPAFWSAWRRLEAGEIDAIVFWHPDRFCSGGHGTEFAYWWDMSQEFGDGIRFVINEPPREGKHKGVMAAMAGDEAHETWDTFIEKAKTGREGHAKRNEFAGGALPFWIHWTRPVKKEDGTTTPGEFSLKDEEAALVTRIINLFESGLGSEKIANLLTEEAIPTPSTRNPHWRTHLKRRRPTVWDGATILSILHNRALCGEYVYGGRPRTGKKPKTRAQEPAVIKLKDNEGNPVSLITSEHFEAIQRQLLDNRKFGSERSSGGWLLQGLILSEACGYRYAARTDGRTHRRVYRCPGHWLKRHRGESEKRCACPAQPADELEKAVVATVRKLLADPDARRRAVSDYLASLESRRTMLAAQLKPLDSDVERIQTLLDDLTVDFRFGRLSEARYEKEAALLEAERLTLQRRRENFGAVERELRQVEESLSAINEAISDGLLHVAVIHHGKRGTPGAITWLDNDSEDFIVRQEAFIDLARRLRLRVIVRRDGSRIATGLFEPIEIVDHVPNSPRTASAPAGSGRRRRE